ncbi:CapA family protein [Mesorhizobium sp. M1338]|uniref:CapA family protein n=1 Tax=Mesorhizobium sp. M1338 TaxID=2957085 RepID=UPI003336D1C4
MPYVLPTNPLEDCPVSPEIQEAIQKARIFGWWDFPLDDVGVDELEFTDNDIAYWHYTSGNPVTRTKRQVSEAIFKDNASIVRLPKGFKAKQSLTLGGAGDLIRANGLEQSKDILFEGIEDILFRKDVLISNYESVVVDEQVAKNYAVDGKSFIMCCSEAQYKTLTGHKGRCFDILNVANNHSLDMGCQALSLTQNLMERDGIVDIGAPRTPEEYGRAKVFSCNGIRLGLVSVTFSLNGLPVPEGKDFRVHTSKLMSRHVPTDLTLLRAQIQDCKEKGCDFIIASIHWGVEFEFFPRLRQIEAAHSLIEEGVDLILGHHPHVIQPVEYYRTKRDPNRVAVIAYSLGSLTWGWYTDPHLILSLVVNFGLAKGRHGKETKTYIESAAAIPVFRNIVRDGDRALMRIEKLWDHISLDDHDASSIRKMKEYFDLAMGGCSTKAHSSRPVNIGGSPV